MPVFSCHHCGQPINADETLAGVEVGCPACFNGVKVPGPVPSQNDQPYQPPVFVQAASRSSPYGDQDSSAPDKWRIWAPVLGTVIASILCLLKRISEKPRNLDVALGNTGLGSIIASTIGYTLAAVIIALLIALIIAGIAKAFKKPFLTMLTRSYGIGVVLASLLMLAGPIMNPRNAHTASPSPSPSSSSSRISENTREELNKLQADMERMGDDKVPANEASPAKPKPLPAEATDDVGKLVLVTRQYFEELVALQKGYTDELDKIGFMRLLDGERVMADSDFSQSYDMLARVRVLLRKQGIKMRESLASLPAKIRASSISPASKEDQARGAEKGTPPAMRTFDETWGLEESIVNNMEAIINLLSKRRGHWHVSNNQFVFDDTSDLAAFNAAMDKTNADAARQNEIRQQGQQKTGKMFDDMRTALPK